ncbi:aspartyl protease, putative [Plasmodium gallinaceum]|uniref:Aspartyl protease, putative n=1 Tax=Plasmodium gallinaceum TaxID=5849 RepID=A0A1J1GX11_PLAGA|nr:aspartyl protease, putative [Plasmodium gallinaceum]CRG96980.1 aspartyl protease, putative [Plasmodium gallinaceum]
MVKNGFHVFISIFLLNIYIIKCSVNYFNEIVDKNHCETCNNKKKNDKYSDDVLNNVINKNDYNKNLYNGDINELINPVKSYNKNENNHINSKKLEENNYNEIRKKEENEEMSNDVKKYFLNFKKKEDNKFYTLKLNEFNFRWSIPLYIGSKKTKIELCIITSSSITALYCTDSFKEKDNLKKLKYNINESIDLRYVECRSKSCDNILNNECLPLKNYFKMLHEYNIKKKNCKDRFCDYINNMNFLNMIDKLNDRNISVCSFNSTIDNDQIKGFYFKDSFYINNTVKYFYDYFGCISESDYLKFNEVLSGFIGLGNYNENNNKKYPTILNSFIHKSISKKNIFALCFVENSGLISFGGYEKSILKKKEHIPKLEINRRKIIRDREEEMPVEDIDQYEILWLHYSNPNKSIYNIFLKEANVNSKSKKLINTIKRDAIVDSYNYFLSLPADITAKIKTFIYNECSDKTNECSRLIEKGIFELKNKNINNFPQIELVFNEGTLIIEPNDYIIHEGDGIYRVLINSSGVLKLGIPFFLNKYLIFDNENKKLGISKSDCNFQVDNEKITGIDMSLSNMDDHGLIKDYNVINQGFFEKNKIVIITIFILFFVGSIIGSIFYFC